MATDDIAHGPQRGPGDGPALLHALCLALVCLALMALFWVATTLLAAHPEHSPGLAQSAYAALALGLASLALAAGSAYAGLLRPLRRAARLAREFRDSLHRQGHHDPLTGALNRTAFEMMLERSLEGLKRYDAGFCALMVQVEGFEEASESRGYEAADKSLASLARLLRANLRKADSLFRWRSGCFLILAPGIGSAQAQALADKLRRVAEQDAAGGGQDALGLPLRLSVTEPRSDDTPDTFMDRARTGLQMACGQRGSASTTESRPSAP